MAKRITRKQFLRGAAAGIGAVPLTGAMGAGQGALAAPRGNNAVSRENAKPGTTEWELDNVAVAGEIEGYASLTSVDRGFSIGFHVRSVDRFYTIELFRLGWYGGLGGRRMTAPIRLERINQPLPTPGPDGLVECTWRRSYALLVPWSTDETDWCSGMYVAKLTGEASGKQRYIPFVVRDDDRASAYLFQSSATTTQAYNNWGGKSLYDFNSTNEQRAFRVSFNRPDNDGGGGGSGFLVNSFAGWELRTIRFLEREGYDVTYSTNIDTHARPGRLNWHRAFLSVGHDEYWTWRMRNSIEGIIRQGVSVAFMSANTCYFQCRLEPSPRTGATDRTLVCYKEAYRQDPVYANPLTRRQSTTLFRDPVVNRPEDAMIGVMYDFYPANDALVVDNASHWIYAGTGLVNGSRLPGLVGYEADRIFGNAPTSLVRLAHSPLANGQGSADMTIYTHASGATVLATGSMQFSFGLDNYLAGIDHPDVSSPAAKRMMRNLLARFVA